MSTGSFRTLFQHLTVCVLFTLAWMKLARWYFYRHDRDYWLFVGCYLVAVFLALLPLWVRIVRESAFKRILLVAVVLFLSIPWGEISRLNFSTSREDWSRQILVQSIFLYLVLVVVSEIPLMRDFFVKVSRNFIVRVSESRALYWFPPILFFCFCTWIAFAVYRNTPMTQDTASHLFQAKIFLKGHLFAPSPRFPEFFSRTTDMLVMKDGRWFSMYLPGFALLLAPLLALHVEWLIGPLLGSVTLWIWILYAERWHGRKVAAVLACLFFLSPFVFTMFSTLMVHSLEAFVAASIFYLARRSLEESSPMLMVLLFAAVFLAVITRGFSLLPFLAPLFLYSSWMEFRSRKSLRLGAVIFAAVLAGGSAIAFYNARTTGDPWVTGYSLYAPNRYGPGSVSDGESWSNQRGLENTSNNLLGLNSWLTGWYSGSLFLLLLFALLSDELNSWDAVFICCAGALLLFYYFYTIQDLVFGPRFYFPVAPVLLLFLARLPFVKFLRFPGAAARVRCLFVVSILTFIPVRLPHFVHIYNVADSQAGRLKSEADATENKELIFLDPETHQHFVNWNEPFFQGKVIYCRDLGKENRLMMQEFPEYRPVYFRRLIKSGRGDFQDGYMLTAEGGSLLAPHISFFQLALAIEATANYPDLDCLDVCYAELYHGGRSDLLLKDVEDHASQSESTVADLQQHFRKGLFHAARVVLLPKYSFEFQKTLWKSDFDFFAFAKELDSSIAEFSNAGPIGSELLNQMRKVKLRIDRNEDGVLSQPEMESYLSAKMHELKLQ